MGPHKEQKPSVIAVMGFLAAGLAAGVILGLFITIGPELPQVEALADYEPGALTRVWSADGVLLTEWYQQRRRPLPLDRMPEKLKQAVVAVEDRRFATHPGVDFFRILAALVVDLKDWAPTQGGSTITQQLAKNLFLTPDKTIPRKIREAFLALRIEQRYTKDEILEFYLNQIPFGEGAYGAQAAAEVYFGRDVASLGLAECALLAGLPQNPDIYNPYTSPAAVLDRRRTVLGALVRTGAIRPEEARTADQEPLALAPRGRPPGLAGDFVRWVEEGLAAQYGASTVYRGGLQVHTTLDTRMQALAQAVLGQGAAALEKQMPPPKADGSSTWREQVQAALVAIDNPSGRVIAWVSGVGLEDSPIDRVRRLPRRPGTALLPLVYTAAVEQGMTQANRVWDAPFDLPAGDGAAPYPIKNPSDRFEGEITFRRAVEREARIPAVKVLGLAGLETFLQTARALGLDTPLENDLSAALGRMPKTLLELTSAYHAIQNGGVYVSPYGVHQVKDRGGRSMDAHPPTRRIAVSPETAYIVTDMLAGSFRANGPGSDIPLDRPLAGVSGTVEEGTDAWFIGYSPELTVGVWVGLDSGSPLPVEAEAKGAAKALWLEFMRRALADQPPRDFSRPPGIVQVFIDPVSGRRTNPSDPAGVSAAFRAGTSPE